MRIGIDARAYTWAGIGRYTRNLLRELAECAQQHDFVVLLTPAGKAAYTGPFETRVVESSYYTWREQLIFWRQVEALDVDLVHFTHFNVPLLLRKPFVVTIHDITRFIFPGQKRQSLLQQVMYEYVLARAVTRAHHVITVSQTTARELAGLPVGRPRVQTTIYEGVEKRFFVPVSSLERTKLRMMLGTDDPYVLYVGVWMSHKNLLRLMETYSTVRRRRGQLRLVMTGKPVPGYNNLIDVARRLGIEDGVIFPGFVPDELLPALYAEASCFLFPSLYEGFGLPALEAAACGTPVVTSSVSSMPEVMGEAAVYTNPEYVPSIVQGVESTLTDGALRQHLSEAGRAQAKRFSWRRAAQQHVAVYETAFIKHE